MTVAVAGNPERLAAIIKSVSSAWPTACWLFTEDGLGAHTRHARFIYSLEVHFLRGNVSLGGRQNGSATTKANQLGQAARLYSVAVWCEAWSAGTADCKAGLAANAGSTT